MKAPERIYLQVEDFDETEFDYETTWCDDKINDDDIEYIRSDTAERQKREIADMVYGCILSQTNMMAAAVTIKTLIMNYETPQSQ